MFTPPQINSPARIAGIVGSSVACSGWPRRVWLATVPAEVSLVRHLGYAVFQLVVVVGLGGLATLGAAGSAWWGRVGIGLAILSFVLLIGGEFIALSDPATVKAIFYRGAPVRAGLVLAGVAVLRAGRWSGWRRFVPLAIGVYCSWSSCRRHRVR